MSLLFRIVYAGHANGTHHKLALDALQRLTRADAEAWQRLFLKHAELYLKGSKAPDNEFKDFKNHVLHVRDGFWGGAPEKVASWYAHLVTALKDGQWSEAVWCAGVLSHYFTDPIHPFHTAQSEAENSIHRAVEWSINRDYDALRREADLRQPNLLVEAPHGEHWLKDFVCRSAEKANGQYERLIAHYDVNVGVVDPPLGLDELAREIVGDLVIYAADAFARVLERAIAEAAATAPAVSLSLDTVLATIRIPAKRLQKRLANAEDRRIVEAMYDELIATGRVDKTLPEDDRVVRDAYEREVLAPRRAEHAGVRAERLPGPRSIAATPIRAAAPAASAGPSGDFEVRAVAPQQPKQTVAAAAAPAQRFAAALGSVPRVRPASAPSLTARLDAATTDTVAATPTSAPAAAPAPAPEPAPRRAAPRLRAGDALEAAPSIGPKTAARFEAIGIHTVGDFLDADAETMADLIDARHIPADVIAGWQDQARLVMTVAGLNGTGAQLLVGAGYATADAIAEADAVALSADLLKFAASTEGQRILRDGEPPDVERIKGWIEAAGEALAA